VNPYGIGDVLFTTPLLSNLRRAYPDIFLAVLLGSRTKEVLENNGDVNKIYVFDKGKFDSLSRINAFRMLYDLIKELRPERFNLLIDLSNSSQYGFISKFFLRVPRRVGFNYRKRGRFLTDRIELKGYREKHVVEYYLDLIRHLGINVRPEKLKFSVSASSLNWAKVFLKNSGIKPDDLLIGIVPGGGSSWAKDAVYKRWPAEKFSRTADRLIDELEAKVIIMGDSSEKELCREVMGLMKNKAFSACGETTLPEFAALCGLSRLIICNDGGPLHVAVSREVPTVSLFGPVDERIYGPYPDEAKNCVVKKNLNCRPCYNDFRFKACPGKDCLRLIGVDEVYEKVKTLLLQHTS
ncbi:MAG: lipopolysaccharide heptosyltransferase II, partial [Candidatus Omnitrophica bacterium]|nr:lipopolysaccharide heptosyltransferase II [Candidatus Omnitrophota bacterium]